MVREQLRGFSRDAVLYGVGDALGRVVGLVMFPVLSRIFVPADYGSIDLLTVSFGFLMTALQFGVPSGVQRFYYRRDRAARRLMVTSSCLLLVIVAGVVGTVLCVTSPYLARLIPDSGYPLQPAILVLGLSLPIAIANDQFVLLLRLDRRAIAFSGLSILRIVLTPVLTAIAVVSLDWGITGVFVAQLATYCALFGLLLVMNRHQFTMRASLTDALAIVRFGLPGHPAILIRQGMNLLPRYLLAIFAPLQAVGLFGVALRLGGVQRIALEAFNRAWNPFAYANEGSKSEARIYELALKGAAAVFGILVLLLSLFAPEALRVLAPGEYGPAAILVPGLTLYFTLDGISLLFSTILYTRGAVHWTSYLGLVHLVVFIGIGLYLVPLYGPKGLIASMLAAATVYAAGYAILARRLFEFHIPWARLAAFFTVVITVVVGGLSLDASTAVVIGTKLALALAAGMTAMFILFTRSERAAILEASVVQRWRTRRS
jgi:O-antigen/teichoic acid export membrane protein